MIICLMDLPLGIVTKPQFNGVLSGAQIWLCCLGRYVQFGVSYLVFQ